jgi:acid phosphatase (class A)
MSNTATVTSILRFVFIALTLVVGIARADSTPWIVPRSIDLTLYLAPPPAPGSAAQSTDLAAVLEAQRTRTGDEVRRSQLDQEVSVGRFADILGERFTAGSLPKTFELAAEACREAAAVVGAAKKAWQRPRPQVASSDVKPVVRFSTDGSYPSGHAACGYLWAVLLADLVPERRAALFSRGTEYGRNRIVGGVHFPTDVEAGRMSAAVIAGSLFASAEFRAALESARAELRGWCTSSGTCAEKLP